MMIDKNVEAYSERENELRRREVQLSKEREWKERKNLERTVCQLVEESNRQGDEGLEWHNKKGIIK